MDALGHVNNVQYFRYLESGRIAYFSGLAAGIDAVAQLVSADIQCTFLRQLHYPQVIEVGTRVSRLGQRSLSVACAIFVKGQDSPAATSTAALVWFDFAEQRAAAIPPALRRAIVEFEPMTPLSS